VSNDLSQSPWVALRPLKEELFGDLSIGIRTFCHDANNALAAAFAANDLALQANNDESQAKRLNRSMRQLTKLQRLVQQAQSIPWRQGPNTLDATNVRNDVQAVASQRGVTFGWDSPADLAGLCTRLGADRVRHVCLILITLADGLRTNSVSEAVEIVIASTSDNEGCQLLASVRTKSAGRVPTSLPAGHLGMGLTSIATVVEQAHGVVAWRAALPDFDMRVVLPTPDARLS
jgi:hypothetical protein